MNIADEARFVRRYECTVLGQIFAAEFDIGFLQPQRRVSHAHNHVAVELIAVHTGISGVRVDTDASAPRRRDSPDPRRGVSRQRHGGTAG